MIAVPEVKVCGITRLEDGQNAISLGASFLGFILFEGSLDTLIQKRLAKFGMN